MFAVLLRIYDPYISSNIISLNPMREKKHTFALKLNRERIRQIPLTSKIKSHLAKLIRQICKFKFINLQANMKQYSHMSRISNEKKEHKEECILFNLRQIQYQDEKYESSKRMRERIASKRKKIVYGKQLNLHNDTYWSVFFMSALSLSIRLVSIFSRMIFVSSYILLLFFGMRSA